MKKLLSESEIKRFQQLAGIKPLYINEQIMPKFDSERDIPLIKQKLKQTLDNVKESTCDIVEKIQSSEAWQKIEAEVQKEYESGGERIKEAIKKIWDIISKIASLLAKGIRSKDAREQAENLVDAGIGIAIVHTLWDVFADIGIGWWDSMQSHAHWVGGLIVLKVTIKILNIVYMKWGKSKDEGISEQFDDSCEPLLTDEEKEQILDSAGDEEIE